MSLTSLSFFAVVVVTALIYYILPIRFRWVAILLANLFFLYTCESFAVLGIWLFTVAITFVAGLVGSSSKNDKMKKAVVYLSVFIIAAFMVLLKDAEFFGLKINASAPIGISYYSLTYIAYILDVYWNVCPVERNPLKFLAFAGFFTSLSSGPILRYQENAAKIVNGNKFEFKRCIFGLERILWGLAKKLIIADRISYFVDNVYAKPYAYPGLYIWIATAFFVIQLYTDFSGCVDIALGVSELFGVDLPENFNLPFLSQTLEEFWRRWHITLGAWLRDFILYPILKSTVWQKLTAKCKKAFGKKWGKKIPVWIALLISWFLIGFWHGGRWNYIFGVGILFGVIIILGEALDPLFKKVTGFLHINTTAFSWKLFRIIRTWCFFGLGLLFFRAQGLRYGFTLIKIGLSTYNPWILFDGSLYKLGVDTTDYHIMFLFMLLLALTGIIRYKRNECIREILYRQNVLFQWLVMIGLIYSIAIYGCYGVGFDSASFIYQGF